MPMVIRPNDFTEIGYRLKARNDFVIVIDDVGENELGSQGSYPDNFIYAVNWSDNLYDFSLYLSAKNGESRLKVKSIRIHINNDDDMQMVIANIFATFSDHYRDFLQSQIDKFKFFLEINKGLVND